MDKKIHLVKWKTVCSRKENGGLGLRSLFTFNRALLGKWNWCFAMEDKYTWRKVICLKYGVEDEGRFSNCPKGSYGVGLWKHIRKEAVQMQNQCYFVVGDGKRIGFWEDPWCNGIPLCLSFPSLFELVTLFELVGTKGARVADF